MHLVARRRTDCTLEVFNALTQQQINVLKIGLLTGTAKRVRCAQATDGNAYIVHRDGQISMFNIETRKCEVIAKLDGRGRGNCGLTVFRNKLFVFGCKMSGQCDENLRPVYRRALQIELSTRNLTEVTELPQAIRFFGSLKCVINRNDYKYELVPLPKNPLEFRPRNCMDSYSYCYY